MLDSLVYMTENERKNLAKYTTELETATKVDQEAVLQAVSEFDCDFNMVIHFNMLKCETLIDIGEPIYPFSANDYAHICAPKTEEERRKIFCNVLAEKKINFEKEQKTMENNSNYSETRIGKVLNRKTEPEDEPVMDCVAQKDTEVGNIAKDRLRSLIERIEHLEEDKKGIQSDISDIFAEAKGVGFDVKAIRAVLKLRKMNVADRNEQELVIDTYRKALDM